MNKKYAAAAPAVLALACLAWGSAFYFGKIALLEFSPLEVTGIRFAIAAPVFVLIILRSTARLDARDVALVVLTGVLCVPVGYLIHFEGLDRTSATHAALLVGTGPPMLGLAAWFLRLERLRRKDWLAIGLSVVGVIVMVGTPGSAGDVLGDALVLLSMIITTAWLLLSQRLARRLGAAVATAWILLAGTAALLPAFALTGAPALPSRPATWGALLTLGLICTAGAFLAWNWGAAHLPAGRAGVFLNLEPVSGVVLGVALLGETAGVPVLLGGVVVLAAALLASVEAPGPGPAERIPIPEAIIPAGYTTRRKATQEGDHESTVRRTYGDRRTRARRHHAAARLSVRAGDGEGSR